METKLVKQVQQPEREHVTLHATALVGILIMVFLLGGVIAVGAISASKASEKEFDNLKQVYVVSAEVTEDFFDAIFPVKKFTVQNECAECHEQDVKLFTPGVCDVCDPDCTYWLSGEQITAFDRARRRCHKSDDGHTSKMRLLHVDKTGRARLLRPWTRFLPRRPYRSFSRPSTYRSVIHPWSTVVSGISRPSQNGDPSPARSLIYTHTETY